jgi:hypothetical protein
MLGDTIFSSALEDKADDLQSTSHHFDDNQLSFGFSQPAPHIHTSLHDHNITQKLITVTEDKAFICLNRNLRRLGKKRWIHPMSLLISLQLALATSEFNKLPWVSPYLLKAFFIVTSFLTAGWLIWEIMHAGSLRELPDVIEDVFCELRGTPAKESLTPARKMKSRFIKPKTRTMLHIG